MFVLILASIIAVQAVVEQTISIYHINDQWIIKYKNDPTAVCVATHGQTKETKGYDELTVHTNGTYSNKEQMFCTGFADGFFSNVNIYTHTQNMNAWYWDHYLDKATDYPKSLYQYFEENIAYIEKNIAENPTDNYWMSVDLIMEQVRGITAGYNFAVPKSQEKTFYDMFIYESFGDLLDLTAVLPPDTVARTGVKPQKWYEKYFDDDIQFHLNWKMRTKCSGLVKYIKDKHDIYVSQDAWFMYGAMNRMMKHLDIQLQGDYLSAKKVSMSSYPGFVFSFDDFYMTSNNLTIFETTFSNFNETLNQYIKSTTLLDWIRIAIAVRHATDGPSFKAVFEKQNSGTYNNQWVVVDYKKFNSVKEGIPEGTITVSEQLPGYVFYKDFSKEVEETGYFGSFNVPNIEETIEMGNITANAQGNKAYWNHPTECCRALIAKNRTHTIVDMDTMKKFMKYNDYKNDPISIDPTTGLPDPGAAIGARYDLRPSELNPVGFGQLDSKICDKNGFADLRFYIQAGPTYDDQPYLDISYYQEQGWFIPSEGVPKVWKFEWEEFIPK